MPFYTPFWPQIILLPQVGGEAPTGSEELSHGTIGVSHAMSNSLFLLNSLRCLCGKNMEKTTINPIWEWFIHTIPPMYRDFGDGL